MPTYTYACPNHTITRKRTYAEIDADGHLILCPSCGEPVHQVFHAPPVFYRRLGWKPYSPDDAVGTESVKEEICVSE